MKRTLTVATLVLAMAPFATLQAQTDEESVSLYERLGGLRNIAPLIDDFVDRLLSNPVLERNPAVSSARQNVPPAFLKFQFAQLVCEMSGGPCVYSGPAMKEAHQALHISADEWEIMAAELHHSLEKFRVAPLEESELLDLLSETRSDIVAGMEASEEDPEGGLSQTRHEDDKDAL